MTARTISFHEGEAINAPALTTMLRQIVANNRAGGWRKLKHSGSVPGVLAREGPSGADEKTAGGG